MSRFLLAIRSLVKSPGYTAVVVLTLALGIGGTTTVFSLVDGVLLKPLPYPEPDRLVLLFESVPQLRERYPVVPVNAGHFRRWQEDAEAFESLGLFTWDREIVTTPSEPRWVGVMQISAGFLPTLGVTPRIGRNFTAEEGEQGQNPSVIVTDGYWRRELEADPDVLGRSISLQGNAHEIVGVLPPDFRLFDPNRIGPFGADVRGIEIFRPLVILPQHLGLGEFNFSAVGRLKPGVSIEQATAQINVIQAAITAETPAIERQGMELVGIVDPMASTLVGNSASGLRLALAAVYVVLLIGCLNVAIVSLGRAERRQAEFATRAALGASRGALLRQSLAETGCLAGIGGALGVWLAYQAVAWIRVTATLDLPRLAELTVDLRVLAFAFSMIAASTALAGLLPAWQASRTLPAQALSASKGSVGSRGSRRLGETLAAGETALCTTLLVVAGLLTQSLTAVLERDRGFEAAGSATAELSLPSKRPRDFEARIRTIRPMLTRVAEVPGVEAVGIVTNLPLTQEQSVRPIIAAEAGPIPMMERPTANFRWASSGYFEAMGIRLLSGRVFREGGTVERPAVISKSVAEKLWPGLDPVGRRVRHNDEEAELTVVGVAADTPVQSLEADSSMVVYEPYWRRWEASLSLAVRTSRSLDELSPEVLAAVREIDPQVPAFVLIPGEALIANATADRRFQALATGLFAAVALLLACIGVYGVLAQAAGRRTREIGLRMAVGAQSSQILSGVLRRGLKPVLWGLAAGVALAILAARALRATLFEVNPLDPATLIAAPLVLLAAALLACSIPARRAARVDPSTALRSE